VADAGDDFRHDHVFGGNGDGRKDLIRQATCHITPCQVRGALRIQPTRDALPALSQRRRRGIVVASRPQNKSPAP
jgi:hypothetical protein